MGQGRQGESRGSYQADYFTRVGQEIPDWFKILFLGKAEMAVTLGIKSQWSLAKVTPFGAYCLFLT